jgi:predicted RNA-binding Zn ribbon-like protein
MTDRSHPAGRGRVLSGAPEALCLAFVNTVAWRKAATPEERLPSAASFLDWSLAAGLLDGEYAAALTSRWAGRPAEARALHRRAIVLREAVYAIFRSGILGEEFPEDALRVLNDAIAAAPPRARIAPGSEGLGWSVAAARKPADLLVSIVWSAVDLMTSPRARRVRQCEDEKGCGWLFLDESRAGTRRWCSMGGCGNRAKARRHYLRRKKAAEAASGPA